MSDATDFSVALDFRGRSGPAVATFDTIVFDARVELGGTVRSCRFFTCSALGTIGLILPDGSAFAHIVSVVGRQDIAVREFTTAGTVTIVAGDLEAFL